ncbi:MAG: hypothetical protein E6R03_01665, partial [Hyphomicrobiaceae bacterium]
MPVPQAPVRRSTHQRVSALTRFRRAAYERKLRKSRGDYGAFWAAEHHDPALPQIAEAAVQYFENGGSIQQLLANYDGKEIPGDGIEAFADRVVAKLVDSGLDQHLVEVEIEESTGRVYVYLDDRTHAQVESIQDMIRTFGKTSIVQDPASNPALGTYVFVVEYLDPTSPVLSKGRAETPKIAANPEKDEALFVPVIAAKPAPPQATYVWPATYSFAEAVEAEFGVKATNYIDRDGNDAFRVVGPETIGRWLDNHRVPHYSPKPFVVLPEHLESNEKLAQALGAKLSDAVRLRWEAFCRSDRGKQFREAQARLLALSEDESRARYLNTLALKCEDTDATYFIPYLASVLTGNRVGLKSDPVFNSEVDHQDPQSFEAAKTPALSTVEDDDNGSGPIIGLPKSKGVVDTGTIEVANAKPEQVSEAYKPGDRYLDTQRRREFAIRSISGDQVTVRDSVTEDETKLTRLQLDTAVVRGSVRKINEAALLVDTPSSEQAMNAFFSARGVVVEALDGRT